MENTKKTFKVFFDIEKELEYVNSMCASGWKLKEILFGNVYSFEKCSPGEYTVITVGDDSQNETLQRSRLSEGGYEIVPCRYDLPLTYLYLIRKSDREELPYYTEPTQKQFLLEAVVSQYARIEKFYVALSFLLNILVISTAPFLGWSLRMIIVYEIIHLMPRVVLIIALEIFGEAFLCTILVKLGKYKKKYKRKLVECKDSIIEKKSR